MALFATNVVVTPKDGKYRIIFENNRQQYEIRCTRSVALKLRRALPPEPEVREPEPEHDHPAAGTCRPSCPLYVEMDAPW